MKIHWIIIAALVALSVTACARQLPTGAMQYSTAFERNIPPGRRCPERISSISARRSKVRK